MPQNEDQLDLSKLKGGDLKQLTKNAKAASKAVSKLEKDYRKMAKAIATSTKQVTKSIKGLRKFLDIQKKIRSSMKMTTKDTKRLTKMRSKAAKVEIKNQKLIRAATAKTQKQLMKMKKKMGGGPGGRGGRDAGGGGFSLGFGLPAFLSVAAITAATRSLASYTTQLARTRDLAASLAGGRRLGLSRRDSELFSGFATQRFSNRFLSPTELKGLQNIRSRLREALGEDQGSELTLKLTEGFRSSGEQAKFLAAASVDVVKALKDFQSVSNIGDFSLALSAATMETDALSRTANTLETAWRDVQDSFERFVIDFVDKNEIDLKNSVQAVAQEVVDFINWSRRLAAEWKPIFKFFFENFKKLIGFIKSSADEWRLLADSAAGLFGSGDTRNRIDKRIDEANRIGAQIGVLISKAKRARAAGDEELANQLAATAKKLSFQQQDILRGAQDFFGVSESSEVITLKTAQNVEEIKTQTQSAVDAAEKQRKAFEASRSAAEQTALALQRTSEQMSIEFLRLDLIRARLARFESSPLGFGSLFNEQLAAAEQINRLLELNRQQQAEVAKLNLDLRENQERMVKLQIEENNLIAEKSRLLRAQTRGYLDALTAQAFNAGRFQKILIEQDRNLAIALEKGIAKRNPLLGLVGDEAARNQVDPFRFSGDPDKDSTELERYHRQLEKMFGDFLKGLEDIIVPPLSGELAGIKAAGKMIPSSPKVAAEIRKITSLPPSASNVLSDIHGFDMRTPRQILRDRKTERRRLERLQKAKTIKSAGGGSKDTLQEQARELAKHSLNGARMMANLAELLGNIEEPDHPEIMRPTRPGGRTNLGTA